MLLSRKRLSYCTRYLRGQLYSLFCLEFEAWTIKCYLIKMNRFCAQMSYYYYHFPQQGLILGKTVIFFFRDMQTFRRWRNAPVTLLSTWIILLFVLVYTTFISRPRITIPYKKYRNAI